MDNTGTQQGVELAPTPQTAGEARSGGTPQGTPAPQATVAPVEMQAQVAQAQAEKAQAVADAATAQADATIKAQALIEKDKRIAELEAGLGDAQVVLIDKDNKIAELQSKITNEGIAHQATSSRVTELESQLTSKQTELTSQIALTQSISTERDALQVQIAEKDKLLKAKPDASEVTNLLQDKDQQISNLSNELAVITAQVNDLRSAKPAPLVQSQGGTGLSFLVDTETGAVVNSFTDRKSAEEHMANLIPEERQSRAILAL